MINKSELKELLIMAMIAGRIMLKNGAETYRVEDTILRLCKSRMNIKYAETFVTTTGIFLTVEYGEDVISYTYRIKSRKIDLNKVAMVNDFSRRFVNSDMSIREGKSILGDIEKSTTYSKPINLLAGGASGGFFSLLFGGSFRDFVSAFIISLLLVGLIDFLDKKKFSFFIKNILGAMIITVLSIISIEIGIGESLNMVIIGSIMPLVPGVAITNAIRDSISEDFLSGVSRGIEALIIALSIAFGVGIVLRFYISFLGGVHNVYGQAISISSSFYNWLLHII
ncbi:threonine/serine ThrE exporter family protein [Sporosalibacterium faouarense]|uniref:threonine/serine ThrE exporter family protein n=1 Tax=Sporosalibacterium faouarense TaxID=516123 RepID=UPI00141D674D|nr:threonine/serine exporter family protein [Sporosalibacterium faouarense]MTI47769.1 threonine/serine exporter family protein [Bacillota bacterium]